MSLKEGITPVKEACGDFYLPWYARGEFRGKAYIAVFQILIDRLFLI